MRTPVQYPSYRYVTHARANKSNHLSLLTGTLRVYGLESSHHGSVQRLLRPPKKAARRSMSLILDFTALDTPRGSGS